MRFVQPIFLRGTGLAQSNLFYRVLAAAVFGPVLLGLFWTGGIPLLVGLCLVVLGGVREFYRMLAAKGLSPWPKLGTVAAPGWCVAVFTFGLDAFVPFFTGLFLLLLFLALFQNAPGLRLANAIGAFAGVLYTGFLGSFVLLVRGFSPADGPAPEAFAALLLLGIWAADVAAYFAGHGFGRWHPFPGISPGKTEAGFIGGLIAAVGAMAFGVPYVSAWPVREGVILGLIVGIGAPIGDLIESMIKRDMGVKDTSALIPGHGGILDRFDSVFFVFPLVYLYLQIAGG